MFWNKKKKEEVLSTREIPVVDIGDFDPPSLISLFNIGKHDAEVLQKLSDECVRLGIIDNSQALKNTDDESIEDFFNMFEEANSVAKNEKDFHEEYYDQDTDNALSNMESFEDDSDNPLVNNYYENDSDKGFSLSDYVDDYIENNENDIKNTDMNFVVDDESDDEILVRLPDGTIVKGKRI